MIRGGSRLAWDVFSALAVYVSTSIDYLVILLIIFSQAHHRRQSSQVYWGQLLGTGILVAVSLVIAYLVHFVPEDWMIGLLGLIPLYLGIRYLVKGEEEAEEEEIIDQLNARPSNQMFWTVALITISSGGDNLGIYIPYFASIELGQIITAIILFAIFTVSLCWLSQRLARLSFMEETLEKYEQIIVPVVFIGLGTYILWENQTFQALWNLFA